MGRIERNALGPLAVAVALCAACGGPDLATPPAGTHAATPGVYQLQRVNGRNLASGDGEHLFINGVLDLGADGTWCMEWEWRGSLYSRVSADRGSWARSTSSISFVSPGGDNRNFGGTVDASGGVTVAYVFGGSADEFTFAEPADSLTPHCDR